MNWHQNYLCIEVFASVHCRHYVSVKNYDADC